MTKIRYKSASISENPQLNAPKFHFSQYEVGRTYNNNDEIIDFVTDGNSLYVCQVNTVIASHENIAEQEGFLKLVSQGPQGIMGPRGRDGSSAVTPRIDVNFDDDQLRVKVNGETKALSPNLTGPSWKPVLENNILTWELTDDRYTPESIDLMNLRPIQERPLLLRTNSDNTKRSDESSGPANFIQWKYEGDEYWTNLISISELMNLTLAGVSIWQNSEGKWHFGHKEVIRANYASDKNGRKIISNVKLGDVLFDAGELPFVDNSSDSPDYSIDIDLINQRIAELDGVVVKSVNHNLPDSDGNVQIEIPETDLEGYATEDWVREGYQPKGSYLTQHQSLAGLVKGVRVNNGGVNGPDGQGIVDITVGDGGQPIDTSDCVKSVTINGTTKTPVNGNVSFNISVGETSLFDVKIENGVLKKTTDGVNWTTVGSVSGGTDDGLDAEEVKSLIEQTLAGLLDPLNEYDNGKTGHNYFVRINELNSRLSDYYTKRDINTMLAGYDPSDPESITIISYRTFTIYKWYSVDGIPSTPVLPTSASWDGTSNGLTLVGNTNSWSDHPGNRPNDSTRLWMATITLQSDGTSSNDWNGPIDLTAYPGKDGNGVEFIYTLCVNETAFKALATPQAVHGDGRDDDYPAHWTDTPQSIGTYSAADNIETFYNFNGNEEVLFRIEAASIRTFKNEQWSEYCKPFIWSMWGEDGLDGDGIEYIYFLADENKVTESNGKYSLKSNYLPNNSWGYEYQDPNSGWTDDPTGTSADYPYEFVSKRKLYEDPVTREPAKTNWSEPALWSIWKQGDRGPEGNAVTVTDQQRYYKASNLSTGVTAPAITADPTLAANGSWLTTSNSMQLDENNPYLWFFERITYSNGNKWQSTPVVIRYFNSAVNVDYQEIQENVLEAIGGDLDALDERLSKIVDTNGDVIVDGQNGLVSILTNYTDNSTQKSFADLVVDAKEATIKNWAGSAVADGLGRQSLTTVKNELDGIDGKITTAATQARQGAVNDARTEWSAADATITNTATKATYIWEDEDGVIHEYTDADVTANVSSKTVGNKTYTRKLVAEAMSAIKQESDKVSIIVGQNGDVNADIIVQAINETTGGSTVQIDADHIILNGDAIANAITAKYANVGGGAVVLDANGLQATGANIEGHIHATSGSFDYLTVNGQAVGTSNSLGIRFGNANTATTEANTIYFLYE